MESLWVGMGIGIVFSANKMFESERNFSFNKVLNSEKTNEKRRKLFSEVKKLSLFYELIKNKTNDLK